MIAIHHHLAPTVLNQELNLDPVSDSLYAISISTRLGTICYRTDRTEEWPVYVHGVIETL
jgi:hypothetical protein